jgi:UDP-3-O-[3-hydroxymyristoyl] N-acetylglucosamine deacetylase
MQALRNQRTIAAPAAVEGVGYWSGRDVRIEFRPAAADTGIVFVRADLPGEPRIPATVRHRIEIPRRTTLRCGEASVEMIEHVMAALAGLQIDNCEIHVNQPEMPGCDGSSMPFVAALSGAGVVAQNAARARRVVRQIIRLGNEESWIEARPNGSGRTILRYDLDYGSNSVIGRQSLEIFLSPKFFHVSLAPSRTFMLESEAAVMRDQGLGQRATFKDLLVFDSHGPIDNELRFPDECVRHKLVDMIGDLALAGCDLIGHFTAYRSGHRLNAELVRAVVEQNKVQEEWKRCA